MNKVNRLIFHTFNSLKKNIVDLNVKDASSFVETFRRGYGIQSMCCDEVCHVLALTLGPLASKTVRFLFHSFTESFDMILTYLVKPDNFNRTMSHLMFESMEKKVAEQFDRIRDLEALLAKEKSKASPGEEETQGLGPGGSFSRLPMTQRGEKNPGGKGSGPEESGSPEEGRAKDFYMTEADFARVDEIVSGMELGRGLDGEPLEAKILLGVHEKMFAKMLREGKNMRGRMEVSIRNLSGLKAETGQGSAELQSLQTALARELNRDPVVLPLNRELVQARGSVSLTEPILKAMLTAFDVKQRAVAVGSFQSASGSGSVPGEQEERGCGSGRNERQGERSYYQLGCDYLGR